MVKARLVPVLCRASVISGCAHNGATHLPLPQDGEEMKRRMYSTILLVGGGMGMEGAQMWLQYQVWMNMPAHYRSTLETMDVITRPKVSQCLCVGEVQYQVWMNMPTPYRSILETMDVITSPKVSRGGRGGGVTVPGTRCEDAHPLLLHAGDLDVITHSKVWGHGQKEDVLEFLVWLNMPALYFSMSKIMVVILYHKVRQCWGEI